MKQRCGWVPLDNELYVRYHDEEWGVPLYDDRKLFEFLILEGFQAGLSWLTVLRKRENFRIAFDQFDARKIAGYGETKISALLQDTGIIRNRAKIMAAVTNAQAFLEIQKEEGSFSKYIWQFVDNRPLLNRFPSWKDLPASTPLSDKMSLELKKWGFKFRGTTICYAFMQAVGMVNDHETGCFRYKQLAGNL